MPALHCSFLTVTNTSIRWQIPAFYIAGWVIDDEIARSAVLPTIETVKKQIVSGIVDIGGADVVPLFGATALRASRRWCDVSAVGRNRSGSASRALLFAV